MAKKKILILGGAGFLGSHVADSLIEKSYNVIIYDIKKSKWVNKKCKFYQGNISNLKKLESLLKKVDIVYNFAGISDLMDAYKNPINTINLNILVNAKIIELCIKNKIDRYIYASSIYALSDSGSFYKCSKQAAENYLIEYNKKEKINYTILRFGSLYGPRSNYNNGLHKIIYDFIKNDKLSYFGNSNTIRNYIYVKDAAKICVEVLRDSYKNKIIQITGKKSIKINQIMKKLSKLFNNKKKIEYKNLNNLNHYEKNPFTYKLDYGLKCFLKKEQNIDKCITELYNFIKHDMNIKNEK